MSTYLATQSKGTRKPAKQLVPSLILRLSPGLCSLSRANSPLHSPNILNILSNDSPNDSPSDSPHNTHNTHNTYNTHNMRSISPHRSIDTIIALSTNGLPNHLIRDDVSDSYEIPSLPSSLIIPRSISLISSSTTETSLSLRLPLHLPLQHLSLHLSSRLTTSLLSNDLKSSDEPIYVVTATRRSAQVPFVSKETKASLKSKDFRVPTHNKKSTLKSISTKNKY